MKILAIRTKNLASLEGETEIDFTSQPLLSAGIFAITGSTGAGKSTLLDALCLALYASTPRYERTRDPKQAIQDVPGESITQSDPRKILRRGNASGFAEVDFLGVDGHRHRARWSVHRAGNKSTGKLQAFQMTCHNLDTGDQVQGTKTEVLAAISKKVGLSFVQFTRAVLLAQGDFTAFLEAPTSEKSELLEKLTGQDIYSKISMLAFQRHSAASQALELLQATLQGVTLLTDEQKSEYKRRLDELSGNHKKDTAQEARLVTELDWHKKRLELEEEVSNRKADADLAAVTMNEAAAREVRLHQIEAVQPVRVWTENLDATYESLAENESDLKTLREQIDGLKETASTIDDALRAANKGLEEQLTHQKEAIPLLEKARELDVEIRETTTQIQNATQHLAQAEEKRDKQNDKIRDDVKQEELLQEELKKLRAFHSEHKHRKQEAENEKLITSTLTNASLTRGELESAMAEINSISVELTELEKTRGSGEESSAEPDGDMLQQNLNEVNDLVAAVNKAVGDWKILFESEQALNEVRKNFTTAEISLKKAMGQADSLDELVKSTGAEKEAASRSLEIAQREASENVIDLRANLVDQEPCPVCGSREHPYVMHNPRLEKVLEKLAEESRLRDAEHLDAIGQRERNKQTIGHLHADIERLKMELKEGEERVGNHRSAWAAFARHQEAESRPVEAVESWLQEEARNLTVEQTRLRSAIDRWLKGQQIQRLREGLDRAIQDKSRADNHLKEVYDKLDTYFSTSDWQKKWQADEKGFLNDLAGFASLWENNTKRLEACSHELDIIGKSLQGSKDLLTAFTNDVNDRIRESDDLKLRLGKQQEDRSKIFEGRDIKEVENQFQSVVEAARLTVDQKEAALGELKNQISRSEGRSLEMEKEVQETRDQVPELERTIREWLDAYNASHTPVLMREQLAELLAVAPEQVDAERKALGEIQDRWVASTSVLNRQQELLHGHIALALSDRPMEVVEGKLEDARLVLKATRDDIAEVEAVLSLDQENRDKSMDLVQKVQAQEQVVHRWGMLNQVIGSSDGKKFRQVAQEYTLDVLLSYANVHLGTLNSRYELQRIPDSLGLLVVDQHMGNELRAVNSLSGGESFLTSLALALGLASLSSSRMQVESLFIDEGFGSLDPETLNVAMDALERLHNQGRKVGVISHVQEMTERIPVQVRVSKRQNGCSRVEVLGG